MSTCEGLAAICLYVFVCLVLLALEGYRVTSPQVVHELVPIFACEAPNERHEGVVERLEIRMFVQTDLWRSNFGFSKDLAPYDAENKQEYH